MTKPNLRPKKSKKASHSLFKSSAASPDNTFSLSEKTKVKLLIALIAHEIQQDAGNAIGSSNSSISKFLKLRGLDAEKILTIKKFPAILKKYEQTHPY